MKNKSFLLSTKTNYSPIKLPKMKNSKLINTFYLATICMLFSIAFSTNANAQWVEDPAANTLTTYDRTRIIGNSLSEYNGERLFVQNPSVSNNKTAEFWQENDGHAALFLGTVGYGLKVNSTVANTSRWLMYLTHNDAPKFIVRADGKVGVGTTTLNARMQISNPNETGSGEIALSVSQNEPSRSAVNITSKGYGLYVKTTHTGSQYLARFRNGGNQDVLTVKSSNQVGIGTYNVPTGYKLAVDGKVIAEEIKVKLSQNWPDYVFTPEYQKPTLEELEASIETEGHLPNMPSAAEVESDGYLIGEMDVKLLEKIEELTLYVIELNKEVKEVKAKNAKLETALQTVGQ